MEALTLCAGSLDALVMVAGASGIAELAVDADVEIVLRKLRQIKERLQNNPLLVQRYKPLPKKSRRRAS